MRHGVCDSFGGVVQRLTVRCRGLVRCASEEEPRFSSRDARFRTPIPRCSLEIAVCPRENSRLICHTPRKNRLSGRTCMPARPGYNAWFVVLDGISILLAERPETADPESYRELMVAAADARVTADTGGR